MAKSLAVTALEGAYDEHMKLLFANFVRHLSSSAIEEARREFRKGLAIANQAHSEMAAIIGETPGSPE